MILQFSVYGKFLTFIVMQNAVLLLLLLSSSLSSSSLLLFLSLLLSLSLSLLTFTAIMQKKLCVRVESPRIERVRDSHMGSCIATDVSKLLRF